MAHTRGPWELRPGSRRGVWIVSIRGIETKPIAYVQFANTDLEDGFANANILAAAPELLDALKAAKDELILPPESPLRQQIDAAIDKAKGR